MSRPTTAVADLPTAAATTRPSRPAIVVNNDEEELQGMVGAMAQMSQAAVCSNAEETAVREALAILRAAKNPRRISLR